jgi:ketosteroid isomerase-like protein
MAGNARSELIAYRARMRAAMSELWDGALAAWQSRDLRGLSSTLDRDAEVLLGGAPRVQGADAVARALLDADVASSGPGATIDDFATSGDLAFISGSMTTHAAKTGAPSSAHFQVVGVRDGFDHWHIRSIAIFGN